ncbi:hypothetical protein L2E82_19567 [Cichorium intybus]|uniref:Uncharacterized protein n=1 Tax=Cichorium intybus TaxID=13427 RepID=A0ACB9FC51_CICIN|nr:hypothetical protein L2E82_19567 [Cichorium intybus]
MQLIVSSWSNVKRYLYESYYGFSTYGLMKDGNDERLCRIRKLFSLIVGYLLIMSRMRELGNATNEAKIMDTCVQMLRVNAVTETVSMIFYSLLLNGFNEYYVRVDQTVISYYGFSTYGLMKDGNDERLCRIRKLFSLIVGYLLIMSRMRELGNATNEAKIMDTCVQMLRVNAVTETVSMIFYSLLLNGFNEYYVRVDQTVISYYGFSTYGLMKDGNDERLCRIRKLFSLIVGYLLIMSRMRELGNATNEAKIMDTCVQMLRVNAVTETVSMIFYSLLLNGFNEYYVRVDQTVISYYGFSTYGLMKDGNDERLCRIRKLFSLIVGYLLIMSRMRELGNATNEAKIMDTCVQMLRVNAVTETVSMIFYSLLLNGFNEYYVRVDQTVISYYGFSTYGLMKDGNDERLCRIRKLFSLIVGYLLIMSRMRELGNATNEAKIMDTCVQMLRVNAVTETVSMIFYSLLLNGFNEYYVRVDQTVIVRIDQTE